MMKTKCYIYTRVSTSMQVDGFSLEAQKEKLRRYADYQDFIIAGEFCDEGRSGKSVEGRFEFQKMLKSIEQRVDNVSYVLVFKLSRFGRNAADVLTSLQIMQDYGVNLICVEDGIDSSKDSGKLMISVLSAVAEIERENILVQTMEGRKQKAREGKWNGGFAPYGYTLINGELVIAENECEVIKIIYDKFIHTNMGMSLIAKYLNDHGYTKIRRQNNKMEYFSYTFVKSVLDNPVYHGKIAYGRRKTEKVIGTRNEYHTVRQKDFMLHDGVHEAIISEDDWKLAQKKREQTGIKYEKTYSLDHENILSGILKCPVCGSSMYGNVNRKRNKDGTHGSDYFYYICKHRKLVDGVKCSYSKQWGQDVIDNAVEEVIRSIICNPRFEEAIRQKIGSKIDCSELESELENLEKKLRQINKAKEKIGQQMDTLDVTDKYYDRKYEDLQKRFDNMYVQIEAIEDEISAINNRIENIQMQKISGENVYQFLLYFDQLYDKFTDLEKKNFIKSFIEKVEIYPEALENGRILKSISFNFPVFFNGNEITGLCWDKKNHVETCVLLSHKNS